MSTNQANNMMKRNLQVPYYEVERIDIDHLKIIDISSELTEKQKEELKRRAWESVFLLANEEQMDFLGSRPKIFNYLCDQYGIIHDISYAASQCRMTPQNFYAVIKVFEEKEIIIIHKSKSERNSIIMFSPEFMQKIKSKLEARIKNKEQTNNNEYQ